ncbi:MAG: excinuclease ABC subunit B [Rubellimicrobium sp.]|nr:excinuclease ABC subunit B [Rubellimicrobium sp.]
MRRIVAAILVVLSAGPALAWEFVEDRLCRMTGGTDEVLVEVTFDPVGGDYAISLTLTGATWPAADVFGIAFDGGWPLLIQTDRHALTGDGRTLTVTDTGFGNVLAGMEFNRTASAIADDRQVAIPLDGAAEAVAAFRACPSPRLS